jgi:hypothetical protein
MFAHRYVSSTAVFIFWLGLHDGAVSLTPGDDIFTQLP